MINLRLQASRGDAGQSLASGFYRSFRALPERPALAIGARSYTYAQAAEIALTWAETLLTTCSTSRGRPERIGILAYRSEESYLGVLAALTAGAAFVPLNPKFPDERTRDMIMRADLDAVIVDVQSLPRLKSLAQGGFPLPTVLAPNIDAVMLRPHLPAECVALGRCDLAPRRSPARGTAINDTSPADTAYILFTSGSTGAPKGVPITHGNVRAFLEYNLRRYALSPDDRLTQTFDQTFDLSIFDLFMAWESGSCVCVMQPLELLAPAPFLQRHYITVWFSVPSLARLLLKRGALAPGSFPTLRWSLFCGESLTRELAEAWAAAAPDSTVENLYGPTELTVACSVYRWDRASSAAHCVHDRVPIGAIYPGLSHIMVDDALSEVGVGEAGELCVGGRQTSPGYWRAPELTAARFFERTGANGVAQRYYRTGDLVRRVEDCYVFLGRVDHQVKINGYRIELGEVEAALRRQGWSEAVALPWPSAERAEGLVAVVCADDAGRNGEASLRPATGAVEQLGTQLAPYMVPRSVHIVDAMPLNANGKIDRAALATMLKADARAAGTTG